MRLVFSTTGKSFTPADSRVPDEDCFAALGVTYARRIAEDYSETQQVTVDLNTDQARELVEQLLHDYPYLGEVG